MKQWMKWGHLKFSGTKRRSGGESSETEFERGGEKLGETQYLGNKNLHGRGRDRSSEQYLGLFSAELQPLLDWVLWDEMEKLSSQVLISDQSLRSQPTAKLLYPDRQTLAG